jgi:tetratricopeptide (TPR) repeat protein
VALEIGRRIFEKDDIQGFRAYFSWPVRIDEMRTGRFLEARAAFEEIAPEFLNDDTLEINSANRPEAIDFALILSKLGEQERADRLLERVRQSIQQPSRIAGGTALADAQIYAVQGDEQKALTALQRAIDEGWRIYWWFALKIDPTLESLHNEPEFQAMIAEIEADMAVQRARVREMEKNGELEPIPEIPVD